MPLSKGIWGGGGGFFDPPPFQKDWSIQEMKQVFFSHRHYHVLFIFSIVGNNYTLKIYTIFEHYIHHANMNMFSHMKTILVRFISDFPQ